MAQPEDDRTYSQQLSRAIDEAFERRAVLANQALKWSVEEKRVPKNRKYFSEIPNKTVEKSI